MHRTLKELLPAATGVSESVIAVNLDIRGFSKFNSNLDSATTTEYIRKVYLELIDRYFTNISFFKMTGDGLLLTVPYTEENEQTVTCDTLDICFKVLQGFSEISSSAYGNNAGAPQNIGIGISKGITCRFVSNNQTLDYSGSVLSMASKLMNIAQPGGIVFDSSFDKGFLLDEQREIFEKEAVYIAGIAENQPIDIWYMKYFTEISPIWKQAIPVSNWKIGENVISLRNLMIIALEKNWVNYTLSSKPSRFDSTSVQIEYPAVIGSNKSEMAARFMDFHDFNHSSQADKTFVRINYVALAKKLIEKGVEDDWNVTIRIKYK